MADGFTMDTSELNRLAADLGKIPGRAVPQVDAVLKKGAVKMKGEMQRAFSGSPHFKGVTPAVSFDRRGFASRVGYEIGPDADRAPGGALAGIAVEGGANGGGGTVDIDSILPAETPAIEREIGKILGGLL
jgi:hypothetical protein